MRLTNALPKTTLSSIKILKSRDIRETPRFCQESLHCDTWLSESLVRQNTSPFLLFESLTIEKTTISSPFDRETWYKLCRLKIFVNKYSVLCQIFELLWIYLESIEKTVWLSEDNIDRSLIVCKLLIGHTYYSNCNLRKYCFSSAEDST